MFRSHIDACQGDLSPSSSNAKRITINYASKPQHTTSPPIE